MIIIGLWSQFKKKFKLMNGCCRANLQSYINEFMWRQWNNVSRVEAFEKILEEMGKYYPASDLKLINLDLEDENDLSFTEWNENDEKDGTWSESHLAGEGSESDSEEAIVDSVSESCSVVEKDQDKSENESESESETVEDIRLKYTIKKDDSVNVMKSKVFKIIDFFDSYEFTFRFKELSKEQRRLIHITLDENSTNIFHYTRQGELLVSNLEELKKSHEKYRKMKGIDKVVADKVDVLNDKLANLNLTAVQQNSLILEKSSFFSSLTISNETEEIVKAVLADKKLQLLCDYCSTNGIEKFCEGDVGLSIHISRMHKNVKKR